MMGETQEGAKRVCQVSLDDEEYAHLERIAARRNITVEQWIEEIIRRDRADYLSRSASIKRVIEEAGRHQYPTADIEQILEEIDPGYNSL